MAESTTLESLAAKVAELEARQPRTSGPRAYYTNAPAVADMSPASLICRYDEDVEARTPPALVTSCAHCGGRLRPDVELPDSTFAEAHASVPTTLEEVLKCKLCGRHGAALVTVRPGNRSFTIPVPARIVPCSWCRRDTAVAHERTPDQDADDAIAGLKHAGVLCSRCWQSHHLGGQAPADLPETPRPAERLDPAARFDRLIDGRGMAPARHERITEDRTPRKRGAL